MTTSAPSAPQPAAGRPPARPAGWVRRRWPVLVGLVVLAAVAAGVGVWGYAVRQWNAAQVDLLLDRPEVARSRLAVCLRVWPRNPEVWVTAGRAARLALDLPAAEAHLSHALRLPGVDAEAAQVELLLVRLQGGELEEVAPTLVQAVEAGSPHAPLILETLARAYMHKLRYVPAYGVLSRWIELDPTAVRAYHWRAWVLERLSRPKAALDDYLKVLELDPNQMPSRLRAAEMMLDDKQVLEAMPHLEHLYRQAPDDPRVQARLGTCWAIQGRGAEARPLLEAAVVQMPGDPALVVALSSLDVQEGRGEEAERRLTAFLAAEPSDTEALFVLSSAQRQQGKTAEAAKTLDEYNRRAKMVARANDLLKVADAPTTSPDDLAELGGLLLDLGRDKLGVYWLTRAVERNPAQQAARRALVRHYERVGDAAQALAHRRQLRDPDPPVPPSR